jgi:DHA1 family inner membrane transport protein
MTRKERLILFLLASLNFTHILDFIIMMPLGNYLMPAFNITPKEFAFLVGGYSFSAFVSGLCAAFLVDRFDRKKVLVVCYSGFLLGTLACGFAPSYPLLFASRVLAGIFGGIIGAQVFSIIADLFTYERRGRAMGAVMSAFAIASSAGVTFSLYLTNIFHENWHVPFLLVAGIGAILLPLVIKYIPEMKGHIRKKEDRDKSMVILLSVIRTPAIRSALLFSCLLMIGHFLIIPFINPFMEFNKGFSKDLTPIIYLVGGIASLGAAIYLGRMADKKGKLIVYTVTVILSMFMVIVITRMPNVPFSIVLVFFALWFIFATGRAVTAQAMISEVVPPEQRGSFMSFNGSVQQLGTFIASICAGLIVVKDQTGRIQRFEWLGYLSIIVLIGSLILARALFGAMDKKHATTQPIK